jgi:hypothetical protein
MYMQLLSAACIAACAIGSPIKPNDITETDVNHAIHRIKNELLERFDQQKGWEPEALTERAGRINSPTVSLLVQ